MTRRAAPTAPATGRDWLVLGLVVALGGAGCDDKFQSFLLKTSDRHVEREQKKADDAERRARDAAAISAPVRRAIHLVRTSDYDFVAVKSDGTRRRYSGYDFAAMLESKSRWLGRGLDGLGAWLEQIGGRTFFGGRHYLVRLPDGRELQFSAWLEAEIAALPTVRFEKDPA